MDGKKIWLGLDAIFQVFQVFSNVEDIYYVKLNGATNDYKYGRKHSVTHNRI